MGKPKNQLLILSIMISYFSILRLKMASKVFRLIDLLLQFYGSDGYHIPTLYSQFVSLLHVRFHNGISFRIGESIGLYSNSFI